MQVNAVSKNPKMIDSLARFGSIFASSTLKTSTTDAMSFKGKLESASILEWTDGLLLSQAKQKRRQKAKGLRKNLPVILATSTMKIQHFVTQDTARSWVLTDPRHNLTFIMVIA